MYTLAGRAAIILIPGHISKLRNRNMTSAKNLMVLEVKTAVYTKSFIGYTEMTSSSTFSIDIHICISL